jgi:hypothetical protein
VAIRKNAVIRLCLGFRQACAAIAVFPLGSGPEEINPLVSLEHVALCCHFAAGLQTGMLTHLNVLHYAAEIATGTDKGIKYLPEAPKSQ